MCTVAEILNWCDQLAPPTLAEEFDNVGLMVGDRAAEVKKVLCALDLTEAVLQEAVEKRVDLIITHHPLLFHPAKCIDKGSRLGRLVYRLIQNEIGLIACHTNLDNAVGGMNDCLAELIGLRQVQTLGAVGKQYTVCCYVPVAQVEEVRDAMFAAGAGRIGRYDRCSFGISGEGSFRPLPGAQPFEGKVYQQETTREVKLEIAAGQSELKAVVAAMVAAHPYEEPTYQVMENDIPGAAGNGRIGKLEQPVDLRTFCEELKELLGIPVLRVAGELDAGVQTIGLCTGAGEFLYEAARAAGADAFVCGDVRHHVFVEADRKKTALIDAGHYYTEAIFGGLLRGHLQKKINEVQYTVNVLLSETERAPFETI